VKRFLAGTSMNNISGSQKSKSVLTSSDLAVDETGHFDEARAPPTEINRIEQIKHTINLSDHYLFI